MNNEYWVGWSKNNLKSVWIDQNCEIYVVQIAQNFCDIVDRRLVIILRYSNNS